MQTIKPPTSASIRRALKLNAKAALFLALAENNARAGRAELAGSQMLLADELGQKAAKVSRVPGLAVAS